MNNPVLKILYIFNGVFVMAIAMLVPLYAVFAESIGASIMQISLLATTALLAKIVATFFVRRNAQKIEHRKYLLLLGFLFRAIGRCVLIFVTSIPALLFVQLLVGVGDGVGTPSFSSLFAKHVDSGLRLEEYSEWTIVSTLTAAVGTFVGGLIVTYLGFQSLFTLMTLLAVVSLLGVWHQSKKLF